MKRRFYLLFTALLMMATTSAWAEDPVKVQIGDLYYNLYSNGQAYVVYPNDKAPTASNPNTTYKGDITVPATVDYNETTYSVIRINYAAFSYSAITSITLNEGLDWLDYQCFYHCDSLTEVKIPNSVTTIGAEVFRYDKNLKTLEIGSGVTTIYPNAAYNTGLISVKIKTTSVPTGGSNMFPKSAIIHVYPGMAKQFQNNEDKNWSSYIYDEDLMKKYVIGSRISNVQDGDYIVIEAASTTNNYGYYIKPTSNGKSYSWQEGYDVSSVWKVIAANATKTYWGYTKPLYYIQNVANGKYMAGTNSSPTLVDADGEAGPIALWSQNTPWTWGTTSPKGWDSCSVALQLWLGSSDYWLANDPNNRSTGALPNGGSIANFQWNLYKAVEPTYKIGDRVKGNTDLENGELIYVEAASSSNNYGYFVQEDTTNNSYKWTKGFDNKSVWRVVSTGTENQYYFQNLVSGRYMAGTSDAPTTVDVISNNCKINVFPYNKRGEHTYDDGSIPRGWDVYSVELQNAQNWWLSNDEGNQGNGTFSQGTWYHIFQWNLYKAEIDDGSGETYVPGKSITSISEIKQNRAYMLKNQRGGYVMDVLADSSMASSANKESYYSINGSTLVGFNQWVLRPAGNDYYYLFNVATKRYIKRDNGSQNLMDVNPQLLMKVRFGAIVNDKYYFEIVPSDEDYRNRFGLYQGDVYINDQLGTDGTYLEIAEAAVIDPDSMFASTTIPSFTLTDKVDYTPPTYSFTASTATYTRGMPSGNNWGTIRLPFDVSNEVASAAGVTFYQIDSKDEGVLTVSKATDGLTAGMPALFKTEKDTIKLSVSSATVKPDSTVAKNGDISLIGTYKRINITDANTYYIAANKFWSINENFNVNPFRAYMKSDGSAGSNAFSIVVDDDPTGIATAATSADASDEIEGVYSISGVKQSDLQKGINIIRYRSGKTQKVILK